MLAFLAMDEAPAYEALLSVSGSSVTVRGFPFGK